MDMEFKPLEDISTDVPVNTTAAREHVTDIERSIRVIKDRSRSTLSEVPYKHCMPDAFVIFLLKFVVLWLNAFVSDNGASDEFSPREIVTGLRMDYDKHCKCRWGAYVEASQDADITNTMNDRTAPCIALGPTGNVQGSVSCFNLETKQLVTRRTVTPLPMPDRVKRRVEKLGKRNKQTRVSTRIQFLNRMKEKFSWGDGTEEDETQDLMEAEPHDTDVLPAEIPEVELEEDYEQANEAIQADPVPTTAEMAAAALRNANLQNTATGPEIAGVDINDLDPTMVSDDEDDGGDEDEENDGSEVEFMGENLGEPEQQQDVMDLADSGEDEDAAGGENAGNGGNGEESSDSEDDDDDDEGRVLPIRSNRRNTNDNASTGATRRRSNRIRRIRRPDIVDHDGRTTSVYTSVNRRDDGEDGVLHVSPSMLEQAREDLKITSDILPKPNPEPAPKS